MYDIACAKVNTLVRPDGVKKAYVRLTADFDALDVANKIGACLFSVLQHLQLARARKHSCMSNIMQRLSVLLLVKANSWAVFGSAKLSLCSRKGPWSSLPTTHRPYCIFLSSASAFVYALERDRNPFMFVSSSRTKPH
jgi:hypothetical protein